MNPGLKYLYHKFIDSLRRWHPILAVYYLTYQCDFRCPYCSNGFSKPYHRLPNDVLPADRVMEIFARIRRKCDYIVITGGEPLKHPQFSEVIERINGLRFKDVALNTNGYDVDRFLPEIAKSIRTLIFSLDTLDPDKADAWFGRGKGVFEKIRSNIIHAAAEPHRKYRIMISSVVTPGNISDLYEVYEFSQTRGFTFAACPELQGVKPARDLPGNGAYEAFFDFLISEKKKGRSIHGSPLYLRHMRDFTKFTCRPFTMLVVDPLGHIFYPCLEIGHSASDILECEDLHAVRSNSLKRFGPQPECDARCHSACALGFSLILEHPLSLVQEAFYQVKGELKGRGWTGKQVLRG
jgi:MoaA/NifB/PqqE/SkfB family radical SAM enzyme